MKKNGDNMKYIKYVLLLIITIFSLASCKKSKPQEFYVSYISERGDYIEPVKTSKITDKILVVMDDVIEEHNLYTFAGWYTDFERTSPAVKGKITADVVLYAKWDGPTYYDGEEWGPLH